MSAGILLSRLTGGTLSDLLGRRRMLLAFAALPPLPRRFPELRRAVAVGGLWYFACNVIRVALVLAPAQPPLSLGPSAIGLYSLAGLLGFAAFPLTGRLTDRHTPATVTTGCVLATAAGTALLALGLGSPLVTGLGLALFDAGCFAAQAANQSRIIALAPARPAASAASASCCTSPSARSAPLSPHPSSTPSAGRAPPSPHSPRCSSPPPGAWCKTHGTRREHAPHMQVAGLRAELTRNPGTP
ncbi:hypothetical protein [Streptomyces alanosinicus]|uniref:MFS transporter n=1 Tax=Streptomyces alanosinicus TaxID=68171 RepID=A0A918YK20_9ACTN|nr:hypothetical protein [Streptomyces alanosinicus]GHE05017.1 hypothetical protein GCM10010339_38950 [Streptomyces alanosinicus]